MRSGVGGHVDIKNHFSTDIEFDFEIPLPAFWEIILNKDLKTVLTDDVGVEFAQIFFLVFFSLMLRFQSSASVFRITGF